MSQGAHGKRYYSDAIPFGSSQRIASRNMLTSIQTRFEAPPTSVDASRDLVAQVDTVELSTLSAGYLNRWFSPAIRGLVLQPLRDHFCGLRGGRVAAEDSDLKTNIRSNSSYCQGCVKNADCSYGRVFEPDLKIISPQLIRQGAQQGLRGITFATGVLCIAETSSRFDGKSPSDNSKVWVEAETQLLVRILSLGTQAIEFVPMVMEALDAFGQSTGLWGQPPVYFKVQPSAIATHSWSLRPATLPTEFCHGIVPLVTLNLETPLSMKLASRIDSDRRQFSQSTAAPPTFRDIFAASHRTVRRAINEFADPDYCNDLDVGSFIRASYDVVCIDQDLDYFTQTRASRRHDGPHQQTGWLGSMTFRDVPLAYLPWLVWAGRLGIGDSRNVGAGLWHVVLG